MEISDHGIGLLRTWEGFKSKWYTDSAGYPTIGCGHRILPQEAARGVIYINKIGVPYASGLTDKQVNDLLHQDLAGRERDVNILLKTTLNQNQYDAVICLVYNIGVHAFADSHVLSYINSGQFDLVPHAFGMWDKCHGEVCEGLINRRNNEIRLWQGEI